MKQKGKCMKTFQVHYLYIVILIAQITFVQADQSIILTQRQECDLELILNGGFAPLTGFLTKSDYESVVSVMRLSDNSLWPMPIMLDVPEKVAKTLHVGDTLILKDSCYVTLATMRVDEVWKPNKEEEALEVFGTTSPLHAGANYLLKSMHDYYVGGPVTLVTMPRHYDYKELRRTPVELKAYFKEQNIDKVVGFQTRNPMHKAHQCITARAAQEHNAHLLLHPSVGMTKPGDIDYVTRIRCYKEVLKHYPEGNVTLSLLPLAMRMAGPREALWHALIRKNYGCTHFIVGRDHAGPGKNEQGKDFYGPYDAQKLVAAYANELDMTIVPFQEMLYVLQLDTYKPEDHITADDIVVKISGTQVRSLLNSGQTIPECFSYPEVIKHLRRLHPQKDKQGLTLFFTGLSGAGKTTLATALIERLEELQDRAVTYLDGDVIRTHLTSELGFSREHRAINVKRTGFVASEVVKAGGLVVCSLIAPYEEDRQYVRKLISEQGGFVEIYVSTSLELCEERDVKGLYAKVREGLITQFTGITDPYEVPKNPEIVLDTAQITIDQGVEQIVQYLNKKGYLKEVK